MTTIKFEVFDTPSGGVIVNIRGDLDNRVSNAAFVARGMAIYANALFVGAQQVLVAGDGVDTLPLGRLLPLRDSLSGDVHGHKAGA